MRKVVRRDGYIEKFVPPNKRTLEYIAKTKRSTFNVLEGAVRSSKTSMNILAFCMNLEMSDDNLHLALATSSSLARVLLFEGDGMGIKYYPEWKEVEEGEFEGLQALKIITKKDKVVHVIALGGDNAASFKSFRGSSLGMILASEINLLHLDTLQEASKRTYAAKHRRLFFDLNPTAPSHPVYKWLDAIPNINYLHMTFQDNPVLSEERKKEIMSEYPEQSIEYKRYVLGLRVAGEGKIYTLSDYNIMRSSIHPENYIRYCVIADPGINTSGTAFLLCALTNDLKEMHVLHEYYHRNKGQTHLGIKRPQDYVLDFFDFIKTCEQIMGFPPWRIIADNADLTFHREYGRNQVAFNITYPLYGCIKEPIEVRIKWGVNFLYTGRLKIHQICANTINQFEEALYDESKSQKGEYTRLDMPHLDILVDCLDAVEYAAVEFGQYLYNRITA